MADEYNRQIEAVILQKLPAVQGILADAVLDFREKSYGCADWKIALQDTKNAIQRLKRRGDIISVCKGWMRSCPPR